MEKIVFVVEQLCGGGAERVTATLANEMSNCNKEIHIVTYLKDLNSDYYVDERIICHSMNKVQKSRIGSIFARIDYLRKTIKQINPKCVISLATPRMTVLLMISLINLKIPLVLSERNDPSRFPKKLKWRIARNITYVFCKGIVFQTVAAMSCFPKFIQNKSVIIYNPISNDLPDRYEGQRDKRIVNWCRLDKQKNIELLLKVFYLIEKELPQYSLHIYGDGPERENLQKIIYKLGLEKKVFLEGYSSNIYGDVLKAALFVSTSDYEGISNSMLEAISLGIPSICTDCPVGGAKQTISNGVNGILVPIKNEEELKKAIVKVLLNPGLSEQMSKEGSKLRNQINVSYIVQQWLDYIKQVT